jgi:molecular chaperone GrpE
MRQNEKIVKTTHIMKENENVNNQDDALKDTVNPDMENKQEPVDEQPKQEEASEAKEAQNDKVSDKKSKRFKIRHAAEKALDEAKEKFTELNDKHLRLQAEFDNFRKRTAKEKLDLTATASENVIKDILPVLDDFERALQNMEKNGNEADLQGVTLIFNKLKDTLKKKGLEEIEAMGADFNTDEHEALTMIPAPEEDKKGKVLDVIQKGYKLNGKVIRFARVVVGN